MNREDAIFAGYYFTALADWTAGNSAAVPPAWRIAFGSADHRSVTGSGDLLLGMNAHVNRDLPFVLAATGADRARRVEPQARPRSDQRHAEHGDGAAAGRKKAQRFDPAIVNIQTPFGVGYTGLLQLLVAWREAAWRNAELLVSAPDAATRAQVASSIESSAALQAQTIRPAIPTCRRSRRRRPATTTARIPRLSLSGPVVSAAPGMRQALRMRRPGCGEQGRRSGGCQDLHPAAGDARRRQRPRPVRADSGTTPLTRGGRPDISASRSAKASRCAATSLSAGVHEQRSSTSCRSPSAPSDRRGAPPARPARRNGARR